MAKTSQIQPMPFPGLRALLLNSDRLAAYASDPVEFTAATLVSNPEQKGKQ